MIIQIIAVLCLLALASWAAHKLGLWAFSIDRDFDGRGLS